MAETKPQLREYHRLLEDRPEKMDEAESHYRPALRNQKERCDNCIHLFRRALDGFTVCEVVRPVKYDEEIRPEFTCDFFTTDGERFPLLEERQ